MINSITIDKQYQSNLRLIDEKDTNIVIPLALKCNYE